MLIKINGQLAFCYNCPQICLRKKAKKILYYKFLGSLLSIVIGIFLLPQIAWMTNITAEELINLTNEERIDAGLNSLTANQLLTKAAYDKAQAILASGKFQHNIDDKKFSDWVRDTGYKYSYVGENLAIDFYTNEGIIKAWLNSELHKKNLLSSYYDEIGIAVVEDKFNNQPATLVVQIFGAPPKNIAQPNILGINSTNLLIEQNNEKINLAYNKNLLTHSAKNNLVGVTNNELLSPATLNYSFSLEKNQLFPTPQVNKFFIQSNIFNNLNILSYILYAILLLTMSYVYAISFLHLRKTV
ncbi:MAG: CAP domain-containing protein [Patescibacteria group bacterium]